MKKIFLLDDDAELLEIVSIVLGKNYELCCRADTDDLVTALVNFKPDLMLVDHFIGMDNSASILHHLHAAIPDFAIPVVLFSASFDIAEIAATIGAAGFIEKPCSISHLKKYIAGIFAAQP